jgi:flagellar assembly protein FliH
MTNSLFSEVSDAAFPDPITTFRYRDMDEQAVTRFEEARPPQGAGTGQPPPPQAAPGHSAEEVNILVNRARTEAAAETEKRLRLECEARVAAEAAKIREMLDRFVTERKDYFSRVESDVVQLALAISAKILHREAQVDPMLLAALVRVAIEKLHDGSTVSVRVSPQKADKWREYLASPQNSATVTVVEDAHLGPDDCTLETDLGSADFSIDAQLKEVEQGFFDLLAHRPQVK